MDIGPAYATSYGVGGVPGRLMGLKRVRYGLVGSAERDAVGGLASRLCSCIGIRDHDRVAEAEELTAISRRATIRGIG
jgi:hypothetical protein